MFSLNLFLDSYHAIIFSHGVRCNFSPKAHTESKRATAAAIYIYCILFSSLRRISY